MALLSFQLNLLPEHIPVIPWKNCQLPLYELTLCLILNIWSLLLKLRATNFKLCWVILIDMESHSTLPHFLYQLLIGEPSNLTCY